MAGDSVAKVLLVENEREWEIRLTGCLKASGLDAIMTIRTFNEAEQLLRKIDLMSIKFVMIDIRLRRQLFDAGGLALLDILKKRKPNIPIILISDFFDDYPGIDKIIKRYRNVIAIDKNRFIDNPDYWLNELYTMNLNYDVFISYRHALDDTAFARKLCKELEDDGYRVVIDERDFVVNETFLQEMERCVRQSRYTVAVISPRYFDSGNAIEESIICKVLGLRERKRRLIPLIIEKVEMPYWMYSITGIDFTGKDQLIDPMAKLMKTLGSPL